MNSDIQAKVSQLSMIEQNLQQYAMQKQQFQAQLLEVESASKELVDAKEHYKIIGNIMVLKKKEDLVKELNEKKEILNVRVDSFEKQEAKLKERAEKLQSELMQEMKNEEKGE